MVYTIEVSNGFYYNHETMENIRFNDKKWVQMGEAIGKGVSQYNNIFIEIEKVKKANKDEKIRLKKLKDKIKVRNPFA